MRGRAPGGAHLRQRHPDPALGERPRGLAPGEAAPDHRRGQDGTGAAPVPAAAVGASSAANSVPHFRHFR